ncbi:MAG TPA: ribonuclease VapC [Methanobacterium sp.]|jgi:UPF0271 protein|nr:MAG: ribonuclease VapC [Methanobacterium sp.]HOI70773.1 ribonuclease VapC [Methanobacterium sp.]HPX78353.1 ribonuclease VapC [Methanobacterium sp.]
MSKKVFVLDSSGIIGGFISGEFSNYTTSQVVTEIRDIKSQLFLQEALENKQITIMEPGPEDIKAVEEVITRSGDLLRLSDVDKGVIALAVYLRRDNLSPTLVTDDYSIQNVLMIMEIPFKSIQTRGINDVVGWIKFCKGCKKTYPSNYQETDCEICGSPISRKRTRKITK